MEYDSLLKLPSGTDDIEYLFRTARGSTYAHHTDTTTTRNRSGEKHRDTRSGLQPRSGRTVYVDPSDVNRLAMFQNPDMGVRFVPVLENGKPTGMAALELTEDYGPRKAGEKLAVVPYKTKPQVGMSPVEIYKSDSPVGDPGRGIHFGNQITEVHPRPARLGGKAGVAGAALGIVDAAKAATQGDWRGAREAFGDVITPLALSSGSLNANETQELERRRALEKEAEEALSKLRGYRSGGSIAMPKEYSKGNWKLI